MCAFKYSVLDGSLGTVGKVWPSPKGAMTNIKLTMPGDASLFIRYGYLSKRFWSWISFNPNKMSQQAFTELCGYLSLLFTHGAATLFSLGELRRVDFALDVEEQFESFMFLDKSLRTENRCFEKRGTTYLGAKGSHRSFAIYDKTKELAEVSGLQHNQSLLRIEARLMNPGKYRLSKLEAIASPFGHLKVMDRSLLDKATHPLLEKFRSGTAFGYSAMSMMSFYSVAERATLWKLFDELAPAWWDQQKIWALYPKAQDWINKLAA